MLNPYFNQSQNVEGESDLYEDLIIEAIQVVGEDLLYIQRLESDFNSLNEAQISELKKAFVIEADFDDPNLPGAGFLNGVNN